MSNKQAGNNTNNGGNDPSTPSGFSSISMTTMIHIVAEILVVGALAYYLHSKIKTQEESNKILSDRITKLEEIVTKQSDIITHHENTLRQFYALVQGLPAPNKNPQKPPPNQHRQNTPPNTPPNNPSNNPRQRPQQQNAQQPKTKPQNPPQNPNRKQSPYQQPQVEEIEDAEVTSGTEESGDVDDIDNLLLDEINELGTEVECNDDECVVPTATQKGKKKSSK